MAENRLPAEKKYEAEITALANADKGPRPPGWALTPRAVETFLGRVIELREQREPVVPGAGEVTFTPRQVAALKKLRELWPDTPFVLVGASALGCFPDFRWRVTNDIDVSASGATSVHS